MQPILMQDSQEVYKRSRQEPPKKYFNPICEYFSVNVQAALQIYIWVWQAKCINCDCCCDVSCQWRRDLRQGFTNCFVTYQDRSPPSTHGSSICLLCVGRVATTLCVVGVTTTLYVFNLVVGFLILKFDCGNSANNYFYFQYPTCGLLETFLGPLLGHGPQLEQHRSNEVAVIFF